MDTNSVAGSDHDSEGSGSDSEESTRVYKEVRQYILHQEYPPGADKPEKAVIRKRAKKFEMCDGLLMYTVPQI